MEQQELLAGHVNKTHWNTVIIGGDVPHDELVQMISDSYDLIKPKVRRRIKDA
ncbi:MAG: MmcQ/YjbR family DNA-binding protein [Oscillospiraceae bacterium]|nr:MmcQ/YjbR family DNA-binding protein [Oscillospiraceae bacterium]